LIDRRGFGAFASDGIDILLAAFAPRATEFPIVSTKAMVVHATNTNHRWHVTIGPEGITTVRGDGPADVTLTGDASDLYLAVWNRGDDSSITVNGDRELLAKWHGNHRIRWS